MFLGDHDVARVGMRAVALGRVPGRLNGV